MRLFLRNTFAWLLLIGSTLTGNIASAQFGITTNDTSICPGTSLTLHASYVGTTPTTVSLTDDLYTGVLPIGFTFNYFGTNYTSCVFSSNGYICFNTSNAGQYSPWSITSGIPGNTNVANSIMGFYADILPMPTQGTLDYATVGTAPNRKFILSFCDVPMFSCTALLTSFQIILYETTNVIEVHLGNVPNCPVWNSGAGIEGIQNATSTIAYPVAGRNYPTQWTAFHSSNRWTPLTSSTYSLTTIPYAPIPSAGGTISWYANGVTPIGTGDSVIVSPNVPTFYTAQIMKCQDTLTDTVFVTIGGGSHIDSISYVNPTTCGGNDGYFKLYGLDPNYNYIVHYRKNGTQVAPVAATSNIFGVITINNLSAGTYDSIIAFKGLCFSNLMGPITLYDPPVVSNWSYVLHKGCGEDTVVFTNNSIQNTFNIWDFGDGTGDTAVNPIHIYPIQGVYNVKLQVNNGICKDSNIQQINTQHPLSASFTANDDSVCVGQQISFINTSVVTGPGTYEWTFGDTSSAVTTTNASYTYNAPGKYTVTLIATDEIPCSDTFRMNIQVDSTPYISYVISDSVLCEGQGITFSGTYLQEGLTGTVWDFGDASTIPNRDQVAHAYDSSGSYNVVFTASYRNCPDATYTKTIDIKSFPSINLGPDTSMCPNGEAIIIGDYKNQFNPQAKWRWNTGDSTALIAVRHPGIFTAEIAIDGCKSDDSIEVFKDCYIDIPNSFTPNNDGINDYFLPRQLLAKGVKSFKMSIFNRWGQVIFETEKIDGRGWDGKFNGQDQPSGVYIYLIDVVMKTGQHEKYQGNVTLLR